MVNLILDSDYGVISSLLFLLIPGLGFSAGRSRLTYDYVESLTSLFSRRGLARVEEGMSE